MPSNKGELESSGYPLSALGKLTASKAFFCCALIAGCRERDITPSRLQASPSQSPRLNAYRHDAWPRTSRFQRGYRGEALSMQRRARVPRAKHSPVDKSAMEVDGHLLRPCTGRLHYERLAGARGLHGEQGGDDVALGPRFHQAALVLAGKPAADAIDALEPGA